MVLLSMITAAVSAMARPQMILADLFSVTLSLASLPADCVVRSGDRDAANRAVNVALVYRTTMCRDIAPMTAARGIPASNVTRRPLCCTASANR